jgi:hypothetical protein
MPRFTTILPANEKDAEEPLLPSEFAIKKHQTRKFVSQTVMIIIFLALSLLVGSIFINLEVFTALIFLPKVSRQTLGRL